ncbi:MAG: transposase, partial [Candidatus Bathyarchaeota archaeon]|nr:transposase [Candidatus Bathyarchaeota archaeon]
GIPQYLQVDNGLSFKGSNRHPQTFGAVIKLCLYLGIEIIFIPEAEPWRQGVIEKFNDVYDKMFFRAQVFRDLPQLQEEAMVFENFHNHNHCYSKLHGKTPADIHRSKEKSRLSKNFDLHQKYIPFKEGKVSFIRLTNRQGKVRFFREIFLVNKDLVHEYIKGTIFTKSDLLKFYYDKKLIKTYNYKVNRH